MSQALLLVDIQYDFLPGGSLAVPDGDAVVPVANALMPAFDTVVATQDWHPPGHGSFASEHPGRRPFEVAELDGLAQILWPDHCLQGSRGAQLHEDLEQQRITHIVRKGMDPRIDSYSGFFDNGHRRTTGLSGLLQALDVERVVLCGLAQDVCVLFTALDAVKAGFETVLVEDGTRAVNAEPDDGDKALAQMREAGVRLAHSSAYC